MTDFKPIQDHQPLYWEGRENAINRHITYTRIGLGLISEAKYVGAFIIWLYYALKLPTLFLILPMGLLSLAFADLLGRKWLYKGMKAAEFVTTQKGSVIGYNQYNIQVAILEELKKMNEVEVNGHNSTTCATSNCPICLPQLTKIVEELKKLNKE